MTTAYAECNLKTKVEIYSFTYEENSDKEIKRFCRDMDKRVKSLEDNIRYNVLESYTYNTYYHKGVRYYRMYATVVSLKD